MLLMTYGLIENPRMKSVIPGRTGIILPDEKGMPSTAGESLVCVIVLSSVSHHPLGGLAPGLAEVGHRFDWMMKELAENATQNGYLGYSRYLGSAERTDSNEVMSMLYFENEDYLYQYARGPLHSKAAKWWRETEQKHKHIGILHEVFSCPKKNWEAVYVNFNPVGLAATTKEVVDENGQKSWMSPLYKARGKMMYGKGRMGRDVDDKWETMETVKSTYEDEV